MSIHNTVSHGTVQGIAGVCVGGLIDNTFPQPVEVTKANYLQVTAEVFVQLLVNGVAAATFFDFLGRRGWRGEDPGKYTVFGVALAFSQPNLGIKASNWVKGTKAIVNSYLGPAPASTAAVNPVTVDQKSTLYVPANGPDQIHHA